jgi:hypothetical protein
MTTAIATAPSPAWKVWTGRILSALPVLMLLLSSSMKLMHQPKFIEMWVGHFGYPESAATGIGLLELACAIVYAVPRTRVLGAILVTGYLGGAIATHVRVGEVFLIPLALGICVWAGLFLRDERLQDFLPLTNNRT